ncbi:hypothetical protein PVAG01_00477 [Phlyctema vagabunda]|uniref:Ankyrin repeat protein n=1 Tax=Phlyctema vagabunda TaxID=108571 RepID=A0ABR4PUT4_9HELO
MNSSRVTYATVAASPSTRDGELYGSGPLAYSVNRQNSMGSTVSSDRRTSNYSLGNLPQRMSPLRQSISANSAPSSRQLSPRPSILRALSPTSASSITTRQDSPAGNNSDIPLQANKPKRRTRTPRRAPVRESKKKGPLITAILDQDFSRVTSLIQNGEDIRGQGDEYDKPLQTAALVGNEEILGYLLSFEGLDINSRDSRSRTAMFAAKSRGNDQIVKFLRDKGARLLSSEEERIASRELNQWLRCESLAQPRDQGAVDAVQPFQPEAPITSEPEEHIVEGEGLSPELQPSHSELNPVDGNVASELEAGSLKRIKDKQNEANEKRRYRQKKGEWIKGPPKSPEQAPWEEILPQEPRYPGFGFKASIVEFDFSDQGGHRIISPTPTVDDLIYGRGPDKILKEKYLPFQGSCRWYHLPANHLGWVKDLITKIYEKRSKEEKRKKDKLFSQEPFSTGEMEHANPTSLDPGPQARALRPQCRSVTLDRLGATKISTVIEFRMPFIHWETKTNQKEMHQVMGKIRLGRTHDNNHYIQSQHIIPEIKAIVQKPEWSKNEKLLVAYLYNDPPLHPRKTLDQFYYHMLENTQSRDEDQAINRYFQKTRNRNSCESVAEEQCLYFEANDTLPGFFASLSPSGQSICGPHNGRQVCQLNPRTSASPKYTGLVELSPAKEDATTIETRGDEEESEEGEYEDNEDEIEAHTSMVDQLWMWILDENTIITSFPQNWKHDEDDPQHEADKMDVLQNIYSHLSLQSRMPLESVYDLAHLIVAKCLATFCTQSTPYNKHPKRILDVYESAVAAVTDNETKLFIAFDEKSKASRETIGMDVQKHLPEDLYSIDAEIKQLREVKDIQDELHILSVLLENQKSVCENAKDTLNRNDSIDSLSRPPTVKKRETIDSSPAPAGKYSSLNHFGRLCSMIDEQDKRRKAIEWQAEQANKALNHLLDLKQKQANVSEARSARLTSESTKQQGNIMVLFTLVTIIFAPLSLMATMFGVDIVEYPDNLHMEYVLRYMFAVSAAVTIPLIGLVIYTTRLTIRKIWIKINRWWRNGWGSLSAIMPRLKFKKSTDKQERGSGGDEEKALG